MPGLRQRTPRSRRKTIWALASASALAVLLLEGCDSSASPTAPPPPAQIVGVWDGTLTITDHQRLNTAVDDVLDTTWTLDQSGANVFGPMTAATGIGGQVSGSLLVNELTISIGQIAPCAGTWSGNATVFGGTIEGTIEWIDCLGTASADLALTRR